MHLLRTHVHTHVYTRVQTHMSGHRSGHICIRMPMHASTRFSMHISVRMSTHTSIHIDICRSVLQRVLLHGVWRKDALRMQRARERPTDQGNEAASAVHSCGLRVLTRLDRRARCHIVGGMTLGMILHCTPMRGYVRSRSHRVRKPAQMALRPSLGGFHPQSVLPSRIAVRASA